MNIDEKLQLISDAAECDRSTDIRLGVMLSDIPEWDSMGMLRILTMLAQKFSVTLTWQQLKDLEKIDDIVALME